MLKSNPHAVAARLGRPISPADAVDWSRGSAASWATQAQLEARDVVYDFAGLRRGTNARGMSVVVFNAAYNVRALPVVKLQLARAWVRLAASLNRALR